MIIQEYVVSFKTARVLRWILCENSNFFIYTLLMSIIQRVELLIDLAGSQTKFARAINISVHTIAGLINRGAQYVRSDTLDAILKGYPNLNARWLISGEGEMWMDGQAPKLQFPNIRQSQGDKNILVPIPAQAGYSPEWGQVADDREARRIIVPGVSGEARTWEVAGNSMEPIILEGDYVSGQRVASAQDITNGNIYVVVTRSQGIHIKHCSVRASRLYCVPANYTQQPYYIELEEVLEIWDARVRLTRNLLVPYPMPVADEKGVKWMLPVVRIEGPGE